MRDHRADVLRVLERPEVPLHNNAMESDIREYVKRRKISGGTRNEAGRRCRDTFASLKRTCRKLGVRFWDYLQDRVRGLGRIPPLPDLIRRKARRTIVPKRPSRARLTDRWRARFRYENTPASASCRRGTPVNLDSSNQITIRLSPKAFRAS